MGISEAERLGGAESKTPVQYPGIPERTGRSCSIYITLWLARGQLAGSVINIVKMGAET